MRLRALHLVGASVAAFAAGIALSGQAASAWTWSELQEGYRADPDHHRVLFEDENVRILEVKLAPGERENEHAHRLSSVFVIDQFPKFTVHQRCTEATYCNGGKDVTVERPAPGTAMPVLSRGAPIGLHYATNDDTIPFHGYKIEYKKLQVAPSGFL